MNTIKPKAYSYIRMSTDIQARGDSTRRQLESSKKYAIQNQLELVETLEDIGISAYKGKNATEGALGLFIQALESDKIESGSYLLVESLDRLSRESVLNAFELFTKILRAGITIVTLSDNQVYTNESLNGNFSQIFMSLGVMMRANEESKIKSERLKSAWENKRNNLQNKKLTSVCPAWLTLNKNLNQFVINESFAKSIKKIFEMSIDGFGSYSICRYLNANSAAYTPINKKSGWHKSYIQKIINNKAVYGDFQASLLVNGKRIVTEDIYSNYYPAVIDKRTFDLAQAKQKQRKINASGRKGIGFSNIFTKMIRCNNCGGNVVFRNAGESSKGGKYLRCDNAIRNLDCATPSWDYSEFELGFFNFISEIDFEYIFSIEGEKSKKEELRNSLDIYHAQLQKLDAEYNITLQRLATAPENIYQDLENVASYKKNEITLLKQNIQDLSAALSEMEQQKIKPDFSRQLDEYSRLISTGTPDEIQFIRQRLHNEIKKVVKNIIFINESYVVGDAIEDEAFIRILNAKRYKTDNQKIEYLLSDSGKKFFNDYYRSYKVIFNNNELKLVRPTIKLNVRFAKPFTS